MAIEQIIVPTAETLGAIPIRRLLPSRGRQMIGPFIFMDQGGPVTVPYVPGGGVPEHPHAGLATFTYAIRGSLRHRDSAGHSVRISAGDIALMYAGAGITHEELADPAESSPTREVYFVQMWLALPDAYEDMAPLFEHFPERDLPLIEGDGVRIRLLLGALGGQRAQTTCLTETLFANVELSSGSSYVIEDSVSERAVMLLEGDACLADSRLDRFALNILVPGETPILSSEHGCRAILLGGDTFPSRRFIAGSFVASSEEKIQKWMRDYSRGNFPRIEPRSSRAELRS
ncbi:MAG: pirin family protein [Pseudomonadota bacterium]